MAADQYDEPERLRFRLFKGRTIGEILDASGSFLIVRRRVPFVVRPKERIMIDRRQRIVVYCIVLSIAAPRILFGAGGTSIVATKGGPAHVSAGWPEGVGELVNDPARTSGWNSWFTEWPNDVHQYAFEIKSTDDLNRLIAKLAAIKSELRQIRLSHQKEPSGLGWGHAGSRRERNPCHLLDR